MSDQMIEGRGGCHCGAVRFTFRSPASVDVRECTCSICRKTGHLHLTIPHEDFQLESGADKLTSYRFNTGAAEHLFCRICGVKAFYQPRSHPSSYSVNFRCVENVADFDVTEGTFDGANWEAHISALRTDIPDVGD